jgi:oligoendopeptidase F
MYRFEQDLHQARRTQGELTSEAVGQMWQRRLQAMFGDSLTLGEDHRLWWMYISHFVASPFYVYAYSFGELLVFGLFSRYMAGGAPFAEKYLELLRLGGSLSPRDLMARVGIEIRDPEFWRSGMRVLEDMVAEFEREYRGA